MGSILRDEDKLQDVVIIVAARVFLHLVRSENSKQQD